MQKLLDIENSNVERKVLITNIGTEIGGIETSMINFLNYISKKNIEINLLLWKKPGPLYSKILPNIKVIEPVTPGGIVGILKSLNFVKLVWYAICKLCTKMGIPWIAFKKLREVYDIAISYCQNGYSPYYVIDKISAKKKYLYYHHGSYEKSLKEKERDLKYYLRYDGVIVPSISCKEMLLEHFPCLESKILVVPNLINIKEIEKKSEEFIECDDKVKDRLEIVTVSRISYEKGIDIAIKTAKILSDRNVDFRWRFIGDGEFMEEIEGLIAQYKIKDQCYMLGSKSNPFPYMKSADLVIQTSRVEAHPISILETLVLEKDLIASNIPAITSILEKYQAGYSCSLDEECFADAIIKYMNKTLDCSVPNGIKEDINIETEKRIDSLFE